MWTIRYSWMSLCGLRYGWGDMLEGLCYTSPETHCADFRCTGRSRGTRVYRLAGSISSSRPKVSLTIGYYSLYYGRETGARRWSHVPFRYFDLAIEHKKILCGKSRKNGFLILYDSLRRKATGEGTINTKNISIIKHRGGLQRNWNLLDRFNLYNNNIYTDFRLQFYVLDLQMI